MEFWVLTILACISTIYCCDLPLMINVPFFINNHNTFFYGIGQSIIAAYIFYIIQTVFVEKIRLRKCKDAAYIEITEIENKMNNVIMLLSGKNNYESFTSYLDEKVDKYLDDINIFQTGSKQDKSMKEMTIIDALIDDLETIDKHIEKLLIYNLIDEKKKGLFRDIAHASIKSTVKDLKENEPGNIESIQCSDNHIKASACTRIINFNPYKKDIILGLRTYDELLSKLKKMKEKMY